VKKRVLLLLYARERLLKVLRESASSESDWGRVRERIFEKRVKVRENT
jgi:hypothetical protein